MSTRIVAHPLFCDLCFLLVWRVVSSSECPMRGWAIPSQPGCGRGFSLPHLFGKLIQAFPGPREGNSKVLKELGDWDLCNLC